ncbi:50S ribosomal protein L25 [Neolewinella agarilytica]|uniref:Large ribosomal subunit protein bL25 n=1 Tax=Neolewinella agarilytica TaxID=478744 RepID=A0A1H9AHT7_9BACT|nr:50S ribosomal protein L25 [Neolewinella agarilytica]SEP76270.1 LSU ribosomal protein L25P [Neolewinella agarilytica]
MQSVQVSGEVRENLGKKHSKATRREGSVPAVLYGAGDPVHFTIKPLSVRSLIYSPEFKLAELSIGGKTYKAIVKDYQFHPVTDDLRHIDFLALKEDHPVKVQVPVTFEGTSPGVRSGGKLQVAVRRVKIKTTPANLVDKLVLDISKLELGSAIRVRDIKEIEGVEIMNPPGQPIASVEVPRALRSAATAEAKAAEAGGAAEGEEGAAE